MESHNKKYQAVIFDMDGTLVNSQIDFAAIKNEIGIKSSSGIIEHIAALPAKSQKQAEDILLAHELTAAKNATLVPGAQSLIQTLKDSGVPIALLTRNTRKAFDIAAENFKVMKLFDHVRCREDGIIKPEPDGIWAVCEILNVQPEKTLCVGDFEFDMIAARNAGATGVLFTSYPQWKTFAHQADIVIDQLDEILDFF